ncbi:MAG: methylated-DNA--[protein]-cysteine S-methyltransferase [Treponema sp.]|jgi:methylated-DNA-[protein]-cysteine S-methyltransferase|nr:methylated-DNA--[protein]-cysteine S-methyltransferase [Treponema sp.]
MIFTCTVDTPLGAMTASAEDDALTGLWFMGQKYYPETLGWTDKPEYPPFAGLRAWLEIYFAGKPPPPVKGPLPACCASSGSGAGALRLLRLNPRGTDFQKAVWEQLLAIPYGKSGAYGEIAKKIAVRRGLPSMSAQAVGGAVGHNPISILIPCHRVLGVGGSLTGYAGGLDKKKALLGLEGCF